MEKLYTVSKNKTGSRLEAQVMNSLLPNSDFNKKLGKTTRPFNDLNRIPYDYTVEVRKRFKGLDLIDSMLDELTMDGGS